MKLLDDTNAADYLRHAGRILTAEHAEVQFLAGGVSNVVLLVELPERGERFVLKQAREQLRVPGEWRCSVERIWREVATLEISAPLLSAANASSAQRSLHLPRVLWEDHENFAFAMTAAPHEHVAWKTELLAGRCDASIAAACGELLGKLHAGTWQSPQVAQQLGDQSFFNDLRLDPYYRQVGRNLPALAPTMNALIDSLAAHPRCLVHGDFSPKNLLVWNTGLMLIDCEVGHFGDPAFDLGFFLTHLVLKSIFHAAAGNESAASAALDLCKAFLVAYSHHLLQLGVSREEVTSLERRTSSNLAGCLLARVAGKSRIDYLPDVQLQQRVQHFACELLQHPPIDFVELVTKLRTPLNSFPSS